MNKNHAVSQALDALCDVAYRLPNESKTRLTAVAAELALRAAFATTLEDDDTQEKPWAGLTEDEAIDLLPVGDWEVESALEFACAIEAKLKEKNT